MKRESNYDNKEHKKSGVEQSTPGLHYNLIWLNTEEASEYLRISTSNLRTKVHRAQVKAYRLGNRLRFKKSELDHLLESTSTEGG